MPRPDGSGISDLYNNQAFVAVNTGFEVQIDEEARGDKSIGEGDGFLYNRTGAIYKIKDFDTGRVSRITRIRRSLRRRRGTNTIE